MGAAKLKFHLNFTAVEFLVYIMPALLFAKATAFKHYARRPDTIFVFALGLVIMGVTVWDMIAG